MNKSLKTYLILALFAFIHISEVFHSLSHEHRFCALHNQMEESHQENISEVSVSNEDSVHGNNPESEDEDHVACDALSSLNKNALVPDQSSTDPIQLAENDTLRLAVGYRPSPLTQSPKTSPPGTSA
jgi:hypothetical protein